MSEKMKTEIPPVYVQENEALRKALEPFAAIADEYDAEGLDEARPYWIKNGNCTPNLDVELYAGRGGKTLITLRHVMQARLVLTGKPYSIPDVSADVKRAKELFEALYIGGQTWDGMPQARRDEYIRKVAELRRR